RADLSAHQNLGDSHVLGGFLLKAIHVMIMTGLPVCVAAFVAGALGSYLQIGSIFSWDPVTPDFQKIDPMSGLQRLFSMKTLIEGLRLIFKMGTVSAVSYALVKSQVLASPAHLTDEPVSLFQAYGAAAKAIFLALMGVLGIFAAIDFAFQRFEFGKNVRLTKQEAKQEHKEREGDPALKARIRSVQREMARKRMMAAVKKADVIITNPTHIAIAISYERDSMAAPKVVAKGADFMAQKIKAIAAEAGVPLVENVPLARTLYKTVKVGHPIPRALYQAVAEVLAYVYRLKNMKF
ncbi:MAG: EscU/YscU/HrcU family type III secretion system export apparatus switch protein, partial [Bdellovibrionota bacterium]